MKTRLENPQYAPTRRLPGFRDHPARWLTILLITAWASALCSCSHIGASARRAGVVGVGAAAGGAVAYAAGEKDTRTAIAGAVAGAALTEVALGEDKDTRQAGFDQGYVQGQSDAIKRQYFLRRQMEAKPPPNQQNEGGEAVYYLLPGPEVTADGRKLEPHRVAVRVIE